MTPILLGTYLLYRKPGWLALLQIPFFPRKKEAGGKLKKGKKLTKLLRILN